MEKIRVEVTVSMGLAGCRKTIVIEFDQNEFDGMTNEEQEDYIDVAAQQTLFDLIKWNWRRM